MANLSNINNKFLVTTGGNVLIGQTSAVGSSIFQVTGNATFAGIVRAEDRFDLYDGTSVFQLRNTSGAFDIRNGNTGVIPLAIDSSSNATFAGNVGIGQAPSAFANWRVLEMKGLSSGSMLNFENTSGTRTGAVVMNENGLMRLWYLFTNNNN